MAGEGVVGLKELGAREMSYRLMFVACSTKVPADRAKQPALLSTGLS
jgi:hypothetical protein